MERTFFIIGLTYYVILIICDTNLIGRLQGQIWVMLCQHQTCNKLIIQVKVCYVLVIPGAVYPGSLHVNYSGRTMFPSNK